MKTIKKIHYILILLLLMATPGFSSTDLSEDSASAEDDRENLDRTSQLVSNVEKYLRENDTYVAIIARRGAGNPSTGVSDTDNLDLSGMAHCGIVIRNGISSKAEYITFNLVRMKGAKTVGDRRYDLSELRVWTLPHFFIGTFEKDAIIFLPEKPVQLKLWNLLRGNGGLQFTEKKRYLKDSKGTQLKDTQGSARHVIDYHITNGAFALLHTPEYNLLSDYLNEATQNCNEHLLKTYIGFRDHWQSYNAGYDITGMQQEAKAEFQNNIRQTLQRQFSPGHMVLSRFKSSFAGTQNIRLGERYSKAPTFLGLKLEKERFDVVSVDSLLNPKNQPLLQWKEFKVFRESYNESRGWFIEDWGKRYVKVNRFTGEKNSIKEI